MREMVDRVARVIWDTRRKANPEQELVSWDEETDGLRRDVTAEARAAIAAMREPTEDMLATAGGIEGYTDLENICAHAWRAMIDTAAGIRPTTGEQEMNDTCRDDQRGVEGLANEADH